MTTVPARRHAWRLQLNRGSEASGSFLEHGEIQLFPNCTKTAIILACVTLQSQPYTSSDFIITCQGRMINSACQRMSPMHAETPDVEKLRAAMHGSGSMAGGTFSSLQFGRGRHREVSTSDVTAASKDSFDSRGAASGFGSPAYVLCLKCCRKRFHSAEHCTLFVAHFVERPNQRQRLLSQFPCC